jgi:3',5'-cyclic AMP phosphodiesterase CpdA
MHDRRLQALPPDAAGILSCEPPSFTVSAEQLRWLEDELKQATANGQTKVLLLHCYPADLKVGSLPCW